jgi:broad specificity phosphatase PhoE
LVRAARPIEERGMVQPVKLYLVRHGQTDLNRDRRFRGLSDTSLNEQGRKEAAGSAVLLAGSGVAAIHSSPVPRALETAGIIAGATAARVETNEGFTDIDYGRWQGLTVEEVAERFGQDAIESWKREPGAFIFPGGEAMAAVRDRLGPALEGVVTGGETSVAVVSHLAVLKICFLVLMELPFEYFWKLGVDNGSVSKFSYTPAGGFAMEWWNRAPAVATG